MKNVFVLMIFVSVCAFAQDAVLVTKDGEEIPVKMKMKIEKTDSVVYYDEKASAAVDLSKLYLKDLDGKKVTLEKGKVTLIEYWSISRNSKNLFWNKMRELEEKYKDNKDIQIVSICYDYVLQGDEQRNEIKKYLKTRSAPKTVYIDVLEGFTDIMSLPGQIGYALVDHRGQYIDGVSAMKEDSIKLFDKELVNALKVVANPMQAVK